MREMCWFFYKLVKTVNIKDSREPFKALKSVTIIIF